MEKIGKSLLIFSIPIFQKNREKEKITIFLNHSEFFVVSVDLKMLEPVKLTN
jgi:hypothetical protein